MAGLALYPLDSERPVQRTASVQSCLNCRVLSCIDGPRSLTKLAVLPVTDLIPGVISLLQS